MQLFEPLGMIGFIRRSNWVNLFVGFSITLIGIGMIRNKEDTSEFSIRLGIASRFEIQPFILHQYGLQSCKKMLNDANKLPCLLLGLHMMA